jgi:hypothetical protein
VERHTHTHTHTHHSCRDLLFQRLSFFLYKKKLTATCEQRQLHLVSAPETGGRVEQLQRRALAANPSASQAMEIFGLRGLSPSRGANPLSPSKVQAPGAQNAPCSAGVKNLFVLAFQRVRASACSVLCDGRRSRKLVLQLLAVLYGIAPTPPTSSSGTCARNRTGSESL